MYNYVPKNDIDRANGEDEQVDDGQVEQEAKRGDAKHASTLEYDQVDSVAHRAEYDNDDEKCDERIQARNANDNVDHLGIGHDGSCRLAGCVRLHYHHRMA